MREEEARLMIVQQTIEQLLPEKKQHVTACITALYDVMRQYDPEDAALALMVVAAEIAARQD